MKLFTMIYRWCTSRCIYCGRHKVSYTLGVGICLSGGKFMSAKEVKHQRALGTFDD